MASGWPMCRVANAPATTAKLALRMEPGRLSPTRRAQEGGIGNGDRLERKDRPARRIAGRGDLP
jgi:hypothetical protein